MSTTEVERCIWELHRHKNATLAHFQNDPSDFLSRFDLEEAEKKALLEKDYRVLYTSGVHPMVVLFFSQVNGTPMPEYLAAIGSASSLVEQRASLERAASETCPETAAEVR